jgi:hypothetical protein
MARRWIFITGLISCLLCTFSGCHVTQGAKRNYIMTYEEEAVEASDQKPSLQPCQGVKESEAEVIESQPPTNSRLIDLSNNPSC